MARKTPKVEKAPHQEAVSVLLKKQGTSYETWSNQVVSSICVSVLQGENSEWRNKMLEQASIDMIAESITKNTEIDKVNHSEENGRGY